MALSLLLILSVPVRLACVLPVRAVAEPLHRWFVQSSRTDQRHRTVLVSLHTRPRLPQLPTHGTVPEATGTATTIRGRLLLTQCQDGSAHGRSSRQTIVNQDNRASMHIRAVGHYGSAARVGPVPVALGPLRCR